MQTIIITGASSGIGRATALYFYERGWNVIATMRQPEKSDLPKLDRLHCFKLDVNDQQTIDTTIQQTIEAFGTIDVLVNNAGFGTVGAFEYASEEQVLQQFQTNVFGLMRLTRSVLPHLRQRRQGIIINVSSVGGRITFPFYSLYHSTKWAIEGFSESLQYELAPFGIKVRLIEPGAIKTDFYHRSQMLLVRPDLKVYDDYQTKVLNNVAEVEKNAPPPQIVAQTIFQAANDKTDRLRYSVGDQVPLLLLLNRLLPHSWFRNIISNILEKDSLA
ncbi:MAG: short-chain dehydrogenase/reductase [Cyanobacteria bacterium M5B4]|nr:MAG: short-chain dehydrogenase/reductase [Cyanobacteria bacterium M5B4]